MTQLRKSKGALLKVFVIAILLLGVYISLVSATDSGEISAVIYPLKLSGFSAQIGTVEIEPPKFPEFSAQINTAEIIDTQYLKLVNRDFAITKPVSNTLLLYAWQSVSVRTKCIQLHKTALQALQELFVAAQSEANINYLFVTSGFRNQDVQENIYRNAIDRSFVMPPGHSEHHLGLAADILTPGRTLSSMVGSHEALWLAENASRFGLILRYPEDKQNITRVAYEPWHFRYVGRIHAWYMGQNNFVLEEYIAYLQEHGGYQVALNGKNYYVLYQRPQNGIIFVPENMDFNVSGANTGGYIVTAWR